MNSRAHKAWEVWSRSDPGRTIYISSSQNLAQLIDNAYGHLTSREASGLMRAIDDAEREGEDPRRAAIGYLRQIGVTVHVTDRRLKVMPATTHRNARWYEDRQDRASATADRYAYRARRLGEQAHDLEREAREIARKLPANPRVQLQKRKKVRDLESRAASLTDRSRRLADLASKLRRTADKYGREKTKIGRHTSGGWVDRDAVRSRRRRLR